MSPLTKCPHCRYSLRGLPVRHTCPECGLVYDETCVLIRLRGWRKGDVWLVGGLGVVASTGLVFWRLHSSAGDPVPAWQVFAYLGVLVASLTSYVLRARFNRRAVIINHLGVTFDTPTIPVRFVPWTDIERASSDLKTERSRMEDRAGTALVDCEAEDLSTNDLAERCAREINEARARYTGDRRKWGVS